MRKKDIIYWLKDCYAVNKIANDEVNFDCPICQHEAFFFNVQKKVGICHRASCGITPKLKDLVDLVGYGPEDVGWVPIKEQPKAEKVKVVTLPETSYPLWHETQDECFPSDLKCDPWAMNVLLYRGLCTEDLHKYNIHVDHYYVYIPVYENKQLVQYVGRRINRKNIAEKGFKLEPEDEKYRYRYSKGQSISNYLFNWDHFKTEERITLVENTFNAIIYNWSFDCTTNFGSHLSDRQISLIQHSPIRSVVLIWDEGAESKAEKAVKKLRKAGIYSIYVEINGQPDEYNQTSIVSINKEAHKLALSGKIRYDARDYPTRGYPD